MKFKLTANADLDLVTKDEIAQVLADWQVEIHRGVRFRQISAQGNVAGGVWTITNNAQLGPEVGMVWAVTRLAVSGNGIAAADTFSVYMGEASPTKLIQSGLTRSVQWQVPTVVLTSAETLTLTGVGTGVAGTDVNVSGAAIELPAALAWQLL